MPKLRWIAAACVVVAATNARADRNDVHIYQLGDPTVGGQPAIDANVNFQVFAKELAAALTSVTLTPPQTLGHSGFSMNLEMGVVTLKARPVGADAGASPTFVLPNECQCDPSPLLLPSVHVRKGLPFSFELGARVGWIDKSQMWAGTAEAKWAASEGFAYLPDLALRAYVTKLFNTKDFDLGAGGLDLSIGKRFAVGGMVTFTPYGGWNLVWVAAGTPRLVDFDPGRTPEASFATPTAQLTHAGVYQEVRAGDNVHNRLYAGVRFIGGIIQLGVEFSYSGLGTVSWTDTGGTTESRALPPVTAINSTFGLQF